MSNERKGLMTLIKVAPVVMLTYIITIFVLRETSSHGAHVVAFFMGCAFALWFIALAVILAVVYNKQKAGLNEQTKKLIRIVLIAMPFMILAYCVLTYFLLYPW